MPWLDWPFAPFVDSSLVRLSFLSPVTCQPENGAQRRGNGETLPP